MCNMRPIWHMTSLYPLACHKDRSEMNVTLKPCVKVTFISDRSLFVKKRPLCKICLIYTGGARSKGFFVWLKVMVFKENQMKLLLLEY